MKLSVVTTLYKSAPYIKEFHKRISEAAREITNDYEIILVNDGSPDNVLEVALELADFDSQTKIIDLSRNFGEHKARMTGLSYAKGDLVFLIQCDLDVSPEYLLEFWQVLTSNKEIDVVYGVQDKRRGNSLERLRGLLFYSIFNLFSDTKIPNNDAACRLMTLRFVQALVMHKERTIFFAGLCSLVGFNQKAHIVKKTRSHKTSYTLRRSVQMAIYALTSFSLTPLIAIFYTGLMISMAAFFYISAVFIQKIFYGIPISGWASLIISIWLLGGLIMASIGLIGIYLSHVFLEVKQRPYVTVKQTYGISSIEM